MAKVPFLLYAFTYMYTKIQANFAAIFPKVYRLSGSVPAPIHIITAMDTNAYLLWK